MTEEEQRAHMDENRPEGMEGMGQRGGMELPEGWDDMTQEEQRTYMDENRPEGMEGMGQRGGMELPEGWEDMTEEERREYMEANRPEGTEGQGGNYTRNARKAKSYKGFTGQLKTKKNFNDSGSIENQAAVEFLQQRGILDGYSDGSFGPQNPINRAESLKVLLEALGEGPDTSVTSEFSDVSSDAWYAGYVSKAKRLGIVGGYSDGTFKPGNTVSQIELLKIAFESFGIDLSDYEVTGLPEGADESAWYAKYLQYALDNSLIDKEDLALSEGMTRDAFSDVIYRLIQQQESL